MGFHMAPTPCPEAFDDFLMLVHNTLSTGRVVRILGLAGTNGVRQELAKACGSS